MQTLWQDLRFAVRMLKKNPGFTIVAVLTLAVAIGANAVVFSVMNGVLLRALKVPQPENLYTLEHGSDKDSSESYPDYLDLRDRNRTFDGLIAYNIDQAALDTGKNPSRAWVYEVSANYFEALGIQPYLGRLIHPSDEHAPYIVLTHAYWHAHFQDDRSVVGRVLRLNSHPYTVVGVTPPRARGTDSPGRLRQSGQPLCRARRGPLARSRSAPRPRRRPYTHSAAAIHRSSADFTHGRRCRTLGQRRASALVGRVAAVSPIPNQYASESRRSRLWSRIALEYSQRISLRRGSRQAGASHRSLSGHQVGIHRLGGAPAYCPGPVARRTDRDLRGACHLFHGCRPRTGSLAAQQFRF